MRISVGSLLVFTSILANAGTVTSGGGGATRKCIATPDFNIYQCVAKVSSYSSGGNLAQSFTISPSECGPDTNFNFKNWVLNPNPISKAVRFEDLQKVAQSLNVDVFARVQEDGSLNLEVDYSAALDVSPKKVINYPGVEFSSKTPFIRTKTTLRIENEDGSIDLNEYAAQTVDISCRQELAQAVKKPAPHVAHQTSQSSVYGTCWSNPNCGGGFMADNVSDNQCASMGGRSLTYYAGAVLCENL